MTQREKFEDYLVDNGWECQSKTDRTWVYARSHNLPGPKVFLGKSGSCRIGMNKATSRPISDKERVKMLTTTQLCL